ncbi:V-type ATP synthase subunit A [Anaerococcus hydrogenalis]|uniref:V-type ATP synthase alpha chain n=1 Tax=Anaerococcus hydrogenalis TaxID=33029 RepID=A0A2N6ULJ1_9FIRM|nr:V-type ATP synthase subunit A [Anaerococcus hydrogenalis]MDK7694621.1 V-type ATP synthase subunit A [Anaerococcus hydrogenalis]MDK7696399.1 V-type ATP synthase subunit A [Anaerococcus hydrogenalis]MDK7707648.1 V-type ATP synthase subunit A [Anaerococcus hydrogenalis]PMC82659.1 V-type ATP synthase subunit A [Anaerococcus hydrogenalis]
MTPTIKSINGPVIQARNASSLKIREMVTVGDLKLIGEVVSIDGDLATIQVYEDTSGLKVNDEIIKTNRALSVRLGPGMIGNMFDGIQRPLDKIKAKHGSFIPSGLGLSNLDEERNWDVKIKVKNGDKINVGQIYATIDETSVIEHRLMSTVDGEVIEVKDDGKYKLEDTIVKVKTNHGVENLKLYQYWPVRVQRPIKRSKQLSELLLTGQRVLDIFFPIAKGGTVAIPGGFGTGKTMLQHQLAQYSNADIIIYIGCGERGNEMTQVLEDFPDLIDPNTGRGLMERTILIANTSNMPVAAREASIYTGITMAEYFRDMGYDVALMADSTSRWAEALREISARLEEIPAEEGYPAYLGSRLSQFYERAGDFDNLNGSHGSVTLIGAVSPTGGDFSEPVTENTRRSVNVFLGLDKNLAYSRHYPAINWLTSYSNYLNQMAGYYEDLTGEDIVLLRNSMMEILTEEEKLQSIVMLVGKDSLSNKQKNLLDVASMLKIAFLQQNAFNDIDKYVPLDKQIQMLKVIKNYYKLSNAYIDKGISYNKIYNKGLIAKINSMKYDIKNDELEKFVELNNNIRSYFQTLEEGEE